METLSEKNVARMAARMMRTCRHFNGIQHPMCTANVAYTSVRKGGALPCFTDVACGAVCASVSVMDATEARSTAETRQRELEEFVRYMGMARALMEAAHAENGTNMGTVTCPKCMGELQWRRAASNGHIHAACRTPECLQWME